MSGRTLSPSSLLWTIAWRFLRGRGNRLLDGTARAALVGTTLGVTAMVIAMALMSGYREDLRRKLVRGNAAVIAYPVLASPGPPDGRKLRAVRQLPGVGSVRPVVYGQGSLASEGHAEGVEVTLRGIDGVVDLDGLGEVDLEVQRLSGERLRSAHALGLVVGHELVERLDAEPGDPLRLMVLGLHQGRPRFRYRRAELLGTFTTGFSEFDQSWVVTDRQELEVLIGAETGSRLLEIAALDPDEADRVAERARQVLGGDYLITSWRDLNRELFTALEVQQIALFLMLGLIVLVSTFNVASSLVVLVRERMRDLGVLAALGVTPGQLRTVFLLYGSGLGAAGTFFGVLLGGTASWILTKFELIRFDPEMAAIYFISSVPFRVELVDVLTIVGFTLGVTVLACWIPAQRAARLRPAVALRYE